MEKMEKMKMYCLHWLMATLDMKWKVRKGWKVDFDGGMWRRLPYEGAGYRYLGGSCVMGISMIWNCLLKVLVFTSYRGESLVYHHLGTISGTFSQPLSPTSSKSKSRDIYF